MRCVRSSLKEAGGLVGEEGRAQILLFAREKEVRIWGLNPLPAWLPSGKERVWQRQPLGGEPELATGALSGEMQTAFSFRESPGFSQMNLEVPFAPPQGRTDFINHFLLVGFPGNKPHWAQMKH